MPTSTVPKEDLTTTVENVELLAVGTWDAVTGKAKVTAADLAAMVEAWDNPHHDAAPVKIGHDDDRFQDDEGNPPSRRDGEPAYGWVENLRLSDDGLTLIGDLVGVPTMLADVMDTALRRRSIELVRNEPINGRTYRAVLTGLALLGVQAPAVKGLADLRALFADQLSVRREHFSIEIGDDTPVLPQPAPGNPERVPENAGASPTAGVNVKLTPALRKALNIPDGATDDDIKSILKKAGLQLAENEAIEHETVTPPAGEPPAGQPPAGTPVPEPTPPANAPPPQTPAPGTVVPEQPSGAPTQQPQAGQRVAAAGDPPSAEAIMLAAGTLGLTVVEEARFSQLLSDAAAGRAARDEQNKIRYDGIIQDAVRKGKIHPTAFAAWRRRIDGNPDLMIELLAAMPEDERLATAAVGHAENLSAGTPDDLAAADKLSARRKGVWEYFGIDLPASADTPKG